MKITYHIYEIVTDKKRASIGETMTVKKACDLWWNSVRVHTKDGDQIICYKDLDKTYCIIPLDGDYDDKKVLKMKVKLEDCYYEDADGYPIVYAEEI